MLTYCPRCRCGLNDFLYDIWDGELMNYHNLVCPFCEQPIEVEVEMEVRFIITKRKETE